jgi:hypothetical protein
MFIQSNLYLKDTQDNMKMRLYEQLSFIYRLKLYTLFINEKISLPFIDI